MFAENIVIRFSSDVAVNRRAVIYMDDQFIAKLQFQNGRPCWQRSTVSDIATAYIEQWREGR